MDETYVDIASRKALAAKVKSILGESAAANLVNTAEFIKKYVKRKGARVHVEHGEPYGNNQRMDIAVYTDDTEAVFIEVKNWPPESWSQPGWRDELDRRLAERDRGIEEILARRPGRVVTAKVLMVERDGFYGGLSDACERRAFARAIARHGWDIEMIPSDRIRDYESFIEELG